MSAIETWATMLMGLKDRLGTYRAVAEAATVHENTVLRWAQGIAPDRKHEPTLGTLLRVPLEELAALFDQVRREQFRRRLEWQLHITRPGPVRAAGGGASAAPLPESPLPPSSQAVAVPLRKSTKGRHRRGVKDMAGNINEMADLPDYVAQRPSRRRTTLNRLRPAA